MKPKIVIPTVVLLMLISFVLGARLGAKSYIGSDAKFRASIATYQLKTFTPDRCKKDLEFERDNQLLSHGLYEDNILNILWPELNYTDHAAKALSNAASYRKEHPTEYVSKESLEIQPENVKSKISTYAAIIEKVTNENAQ